MHLFGSFKLSREIGNNNNYYYWNWISLIDSFIHVWDRHCYLKARAWNMRTKSTASSLFYYHKRSMVTTLNFREIWSSILKAESLSQELPFSCSSEIISFPQHEESSGGLVVTSGICGERRGLASLPRRRRFGTSVFGIKNRAWFAGIRLVLLLLLLLVEDLEIGEVRREKDNRKFSKGLGHATFFFTIPRKILLC